LTRVGFFYCCILIIGGFFTTATSARGSSTHLLEHATEILNPHGDSTAILDIREWDNGKLARESTYRAFFHDQDVLLLRKLLPEKERGRAILLEKNVLWIELPSARRPLQLSSEQRLTSEAAVADLARANFNRDYQLDRIIDEAAPKALHHMFLHAARQDVPYDSVELWLEKATGLPQRARFMNVANTLSKECIYGSYQVILGVRRPVHFSCSDAGGTKWKADLLFRKWTATDFDMRLFDPSGLGKEEYLGMAPRDNVLPPNHLNNTRNAMVYIPQGNFIMGRDNGFPDEQPSREVYLDSFWLDRTEVTVGEYKQFLNATHRSMHYSLSGAAMPRTYFLSDKFRNYPIINVSWYDANDYCHWRGKRLPTEAEWEKAARGTDQRIYPWGNTWNEDQANSRETRFSSTAGSRSHFTSEIGSYPGDISPYGALDMAGNVWEWVADWYTAYPGNHTPNEAYGQKYRVLRGGSWVSNSLSLTTVARDYLHPAVGYESVGFRCAKDKHE